MYQVIARKYRPQSFEDVVGQDHVKSTLRNAIAQSRIAHGYIFSGQRGTGKTTLARIMARSLNCIDGPTSTPCGECASCLEIAAGAAVDVIEIDAASNRGINEMRELRENVRYRPARDRYKIFIIDEAHQITNEAFNALLKTIEEPPSWAVFILCTTESHKIPATIASRCQHFSFRSVDFDELVTRMRWICDAEAVESDDESLAVLAQVGEGSVRDSLSALDQAIASCGGKLVAAEVRSLLGAFSIDSMAQVAEALIVSDGAKMLELVDDLERNGRNLQHFSREISRFVRNLLVAKISGEDSRLIAASPRERSEFARLAAHFSEEDLTRYLQLSLDLFRDLQFSLQPRFHLELGLVKFVQAGKLVSIEKALAELPPPGSVRASPRAVTAAPLIQAAAPIRAAATPFELDRALRRTGREPQASLAPVAGATALAPSGVIDWQARLLDGLNALGLTFTADAIAHSRVEANGNELTLYMPREFQLVANAEELQKAISNQKLAPMKLKFQFTEVVSAPILVTKPKPAEYGAMERALSHPEVQKFQKLFGGEVRAVRDLKEQGEAK